LLSPLLAPQKFCEQPAGIKADRLLVTIQKNEVGRIQDDTPPGREMMNHSGALLTAALDREVLMQSLHEQETELRRLALHDPLTGLPNRAQLVDRLGLAARRAGRDPRFSFCIIFVDLDGFKAVNDAHGHAVGDGLLVLVAQKLTASVRDVDMVARLGGGRIGMHDRPAPNRTWPFPQWPLRFCNAQKCGCGRFEIRHI